MTHRVSRRETAVLAFGILAATVACAGLSQASPTPSTVAVAVTVVSPTIAAQPSATHLAAASTIPSATLLQTHTPTASLSSTPSMTPLPSQTASPTSIATKQVLLQLGRDPGDGGGGLSDYFGRFTPPMVLYTDGEFLMWESGRGFLETVLSPAQMCSLLRRIADTGFFQVEGTGELREADPIYNFTVTPEPSFGAPEEGIQVNGRPAKYVTIYEPYQENVVSPIKAVLRLLNNYRPAGLKPYKPNRLLVFVDAGRDLYENLKPNYDGTPIATPQVQAWPLDLPPLSDWWGGTDFNRVFIQGSLVEPVLDLNLPEHFGVFADQGREYTILVFALLPHATPNDDGYDYPRAAEQFDLPFSCSN